MLFPAVLMNFPNSKVGLIGEWSIIIAYLRQGKLARTHKGHMISSRVYMRLNWEATGLRRTNHCLTAINIGSPDVRRVVLVLAY